MPTSFLPYEPNQTFLLPPSPSEWLAENHLVYFVSDIIDRLDLEKFYARYEGDGRRNQPYDPAMLVKVLVYGYATGVFSSRKQAKKLYEDVAFRVLGAGNFPSHRTICDFRMRHLPELKELFVAVGAAGQRVGIGQAWDGGVGWDQSQGACEQAQSDELRADERTRAKAYPRDRSAVGTRAGDRCSRGCAMGCGSGRRSSCPRSFKDGKIDWPRFKRPRRALEERQAQADRERGRHPDDQQRRGDGAGRPFKRPFGVPEDKAQDNFTDPQSRIMKLGGSFEQCYNAQAVVDADSQLIVAIGLGNNAADNEQLVPMVEAVKDNLAELPKRVLGDSGFRSEEAFAKLEKHERRWRCWWRWGGKEKIKRRLIPSSIRPRCAWPSGWPAKKVKRTIGGAKRSWSRCLVGSSMRWAFVNSAYAESTK